MYVYFNNFTLSSFDLSVSLGKDSRVHVFRLTDFEGEQNEDIVRTKHDCKEHKLERTKGKFRRHDEYMTFMITSRYSDMNI